MVAEDFQALLARPEGDTLDFKQDAYDLSVVESRNEFIKHVLAMANTPREGIGFSYNGPRAWAVERGF